jgi:hypothetical protein
LLRVQEKADLSSNSDPSKDFGLYTV